MMRGVLALMAVTVILTIVLGAATTLSACATLLSGPTNRGLRDCTSATASLQRAVDDGAGRVDDLIGVVQPWRR